MNRFLILLVALTLGFAAMNAEAAKRFGGGGNLGKQRATPTQGEAPKAAPSATPAQSPAAAPTTTPGVPAPKPSFMSRWGGLLAGLGIGALLASMFGANMGPMVGMLLMVLLVGVIGYFLLRMFASRGQPAASPPRAQFAGIGSAIEETRPSEAAPAAIPSPPAAIAIPGFEVEPFVRVAKTSFIRLQAANDAGDIDDIRDFTTPEMYAEIAMQVGERKEAQKVEVVSLDARVVEAVVEGDYEIASVRFWGLLRETPAANPEPFDEVWHVRKKANDGKAPWLIAGIQQTQ